MSASTSEFQVGRYNSAHFERRSRQDWTVVTDTFPSFEEAEIFALAISPEFEPVITEMSAEGVALAFYTRRFDLTPAGELELREWLEDRVIYPAQLDRKVVWAWAEDVLNSLYSGNGAHVEIAPRDSLDGNPRTTTLSDSAWIEYFDKD